MSETKKIKIVQIASSIGRPQTQRKTLIGLGLSKIGTEKILLDNQSIRGMISKVKHLVKVEEA